MFTIKFYMHNTDSHEVFACERYSVSVERCPEPEEAKFDEPVMRLVIRMFRFLEDDNPYYETIGENECYAHAFVVNEQGKTIDTLRPPDDVPLDLKTSNLGRAGERVMAEGGDPDCRQ